MKALVGAFNQEKALVGAFSVIVQPVLEPMDRFTALAMNLIDHVINEHSLMFPDLLLLAMASSIMLEQMVMFSDIPSYTQQLRSGGVKGRFKYYLIHS